MRLKLKPSHKCQGISPLLPRLELFNTWVSVEQIHPGSTVAYLGETFYIVNNFFLARKDWFYKHSKSEGNI